jgi:hypothetical protein
MMPESRLCCYFHGKAREDGFSVNDDRPASDSLVKPWIHAHVTGILAISSWMQTKILVNVIKRSEVFNRFPWPIQGENNAIICAVLVFQAQEKLVAA